ncbi:MAG: pyrimidine 5'-nucleotidase [Anaerolineae bacterium]|nr:pyrimidine 5'-nucleotidase [Thermoflexales bacterium]MCX7939621.1 pyrimidine 5'-nucleotidase [Thermoflexales bacterium]MDW8054863.1 pyrimidine 5'-nucleotidase [Anaerolineae bacterium]MDW8293159.1 pyrimidine 5'-nucleotidase [Anaerolineae bacterium]
MTFEVILFDLDETLYPRSAAIMAQVSERITRYMVERLGIPAEQAAALRLHFRNTYGAALRGLMEEGYPVDVEDYFEYVHDIDLSGRIEPDPELRAMLLSIPLRRAVLTNSNLEHAERVLQRMQIRDCFEQLIDIRALNFKNKPSIEAYQRALALLNVLPQAVIFVEDTPANTIPARALGMTTVLVDCPPSDNAADYYVASIMDVGPLVHRLLTQAERSAA